MIANSVIVISPRKAGTHLIQKLMVLLGYRMYGESIPPSDGRPALTLRQRMELVDRFSYPSEFKELDLERDSVEFIRRTDILFLQLAWVWQIRMACTDVSHVDLCQPGSDFKVKMRQEAWTSPFSQMPPGLCWIFHSIDVWRTDPRFLQEWSDGGQPPMILNYRDPRDALLSMVNFFAREGGSPFLRYPESAIFQPILESITGQSDRLAYALRDRALPLLRDYDSAISLFYHPKVCKVAFEELIGPEGGGGRLQQLRAVKRIADHVGADIDCESLAGGVFDRSSFTFHKGKVGSWRDLFTPHHSALFKERFGHLLEVFGYE